jgi:hypothetical protein
MLRLRSRHVSALICAFLSISFVCHAQESRGSITGTVTDPANAVVPGGEVDVRNTGTGVVNKLTTNQLGYFEADSLIPGSYSITVQAPGFKTLVQSGITLNTGDRLAVNITVQIGEASQSVTVNSDAPLLETTNAAGGRVLNTLDVSDLPMTTMNPFSMQALATGVVNTGSLGVQRVFDNGGTASFSAYGASFIVGNEFLLDGGPVTGTNGGRAGFVPSSQAVDEMRIETSPFDASMGHSGGVFISATTKSGNNTYHGSGFDQVQNNRWNATQFFTRESYKAGLANGSIAPGTPEQPSGTLKQPGFDIGGPVRIPKIYNGKDKLFFYFEYDNITVIQPAQGTVVFNVPTAAERTGDFSALLPVNAVAETVYDPRTAAMVNGHVTRAPFPNNIIPASIIASNPIYKFYAQGFPLPNNVPGYVQPDGTNNFYDAAQPANNYFNSIVNRIDYVINDKMRINGKWYWSHRREYAYDFAHTTPLAGLETDGLMRYNKGGSGDFVYMFNAKNLLDVGVSYTRFADGDNKPILSQYTAADAGFPAYMDKLGAYDDLPAVTINGVVTPSSASFMQYPGISALGTTAQLTGKMVSILGRHTLKYGVDERRYWFAAVTPGGYPTGSLTFDDTYVRQADNTTTASNTGLGWAAYELGLPTSIVGTVNDTGYYSTRYHAAYIQDDLRLTSRWRFGIGLRFEREGGVIERFNRGLGGGYNFGFVPPYAQAVQAAYAANPLSQLPASQFTVAGGAYYLGANGSNWTNGTNRFLPNVSTVFTINPKTVVRLGTGWFSDTFNGNNTRPGQNGYSQTTTTAVSTDNGLTFCCGTGAAANLGTTMPVMNPFPVLASGTRLVQPFGNSLGSNILDGQSDTYYPRDFTPALSQRWKASIQREVVHNQVVDVSYNGSYSTYPFALNLSYLPGQYWANGNAYDANEQAAMTAAVPNPFKLSNLTGLQQSNAALYNYLSTVGFFTSTTLQAQQLLRAYPNAAGALTDADGIKAKSWYHDVEVLYQKRFSQGIQSSVQYTRAFGRQQWQPNQFNQTLSWSIDPNIRPNRFVWNAVWKLPFGNGQRYLTHGPLQHAVGGWEISWVYQYQTGGPISWSNMFYYGSIDQVVQALAHDATIAANTRQWFSQAAVYSHVLNPNDAATGAIPSGFVGFEGRSAFQPGTYQVRQFPQYLNALRADGLRQWDVRVFRKFVLYERLTLNVGLDALNLTNHVQFGGPVTSVTATNFGALTGQGNGPRQLQMNVRLSF